MIKLLLDQGLPRSTAAILREAGQDTVHVGDIGMSRATDEEILRFAAQETRVVVTLDSDFHTLLALSNEKQPSVIRIRQEGLAGADVAQIVINTITQAGEAVQQGTLITATEKNIRIRYLPIT